MKRKVVFCTPTITKPYPQYLTSLENSLPYLDVEGWEHAAVNEIGNVYISAARAMMLRKALDAKADVVMFIDHDLSWQPDAILQLLQIKDDVVAGTYRYKTEKVEYMGGHFTKEDGRPLGRADGCLKAHQVPAGFLKITKEGVDKFMDAYPELCYGPRHAPAVDLFNHGAIDRVWYGEDMAFCKRWIEKCGDIVLVPDLNIDHHTATESFPGNYAEWLMTLPGGSKA